ncbi:MAG TPA: hypothetical protein VN324_00635 [Quisquiliibacterium sp.]|nr:hypothetical protein [Quisquiliibacterium sp.]
MIPFLKRLLERAAAIAAFLFGAVLALALAFVTLLAGAVIGLFVTIAAWFGVRSRRSRDGGPAGRPDPGAPADRKDTVIEVEMREIGRDPPPQS